MFNLFRKKKSTLQELIPEGYTDIHNHVLPGIDDGSPNIEESLLLINSMSEMGFKGIKATPHIMSGVWNNTPTTIKQSFELLTEKTAINLLEPAAEYMIDDGFMYLLESKSALLCIKKDYVLVELSYLHPPLMLHKVLFDLQIAGYKPILAHPERYSYYHKNLDEYRKLKQIGCLFQLNLLSSVGYYGENVARASEKLLSEGLYDLTGSDIHHQRHIEAFSFPVLYKKPQQLTVLMQQNSSFLDQ